MPLLQGRPLEYTGTPSPAARYIERCAERMHMLVLEWSISYTSPTGRVTVWSTRATTEGGARMAIVRKLRKMGLPPYQSVVTVRCGEYLGYRSDE